jgi:VWFA-related protein
MAFRFLLLCGLCVRSFGLSVAVAQAPVATSPSANPPSDGNSPPGLRVVDIFAVDKDGRLVPDLKAEEIRLFEDKAEQNIKSVSSAANEPLTVGIFFDISGSRRADKHVREEAKFMSELLHSIWHSGDTAFVAGFNNELRIAAQPSQKLEAIDEGLKKIEAARLWDSTALRDALCQVLKPEKLAGIPGRKVYIVLSDFEDNASRNKADCVLDVAHKGRVAIFPVVLSEGFAGQQSKKADKRGRKQAEEFANETGGEVLTPESHKQLAQVFQRLSADFQSAYQITYLPSSPNSQYKGKPGKLKLQTTRAGVKLLYPKD